MRQPELGLPRELDVLGIPLAVTKNWQTYTNTVGGVSVKYPEEYTVEEQMSPAPSGHGQVLKVTFLPPRSEEQSELAKSALLAMIIAPDTAYAEIQKEFDKSKEGRSGYKETQRTVAGQSGKQIIVKQDDAQYAVYVLIPYKNGGIAFLTVAKAKNQLEKEVLPLFDAFLSTFKSN